MKELEIQRTFENALEYFNGILHNPDRIIKMPEESIEELYIRNMIETTPLEQSRYLEYDDAADAAADAVYDVYAAAYAATNAAYAADAVAAAADAVAAAYAKEQLQEKIIKEAIRILEGK